MQWVSPYPGSNRTYIYEYSNWIKCADHDEPQNYSKELTRM